MLLLLIDPVLAEHLKKIEFVPELYINSWILTYFSSLLIL